MIRALRWILVVVVIGAAAYLVVGVDFNGATLLDRILDRGASQEPREVEPPPAETDQTDRLTEKDRQGLDKLVESKLQKTQEGEVVHE
jgi:hypothetical protein